MGEIPVVIHSVLMPIIFEHFKQLTKLMDQQKAKDTTRQVIFGDSGFADLG